MRLVRPPSDYRSLGIMLDRSRKPVPSGRRYDLVIALWWWDIEAIR